METLRAAFAENPRPGEVRDLIVKLTKSFFLATDIEPNIDSVGWEELWDFIHSKSISQNSLDVSEVGTTWLSSLVNTYAVRPFSKEEIGDIVNTGAFFDVSLRQTSINDQIWAVPWMADTRVIYYRRSVLKAAGVDEEYAFSTLSNIEETLARIAAVVKKAWAVPVFANHNTIFLLAPWVWAEGGDFIARNGKRTLFCEKPAVKGMLAYFNLAKYVQDEFRTLDDAGAAFKAGKSATTVDGPWLWTDLHRESISTADFEDIALTLPPGPPFVGGADLVIWRNAENKGDAALSLVKLLSMPSVQNQINRVKRLLPVRQEQFYIPPYSTDAGYGVFMNALKTGRHMPNITIWAPLESSLHKAFGLVWQTAKHNGFKVTEGDLLRHLEPLAKRFDTMLSMF